MSNPTSIPTVPIRPELLAPAGDWDCARAAIENGADAIYFGLDAGFNARARAANFSVDDLPKLLALLHGRGVGGYVTLNTLAFPRELPAVEELVRKIAAAGVDAVLVQDIGVARLVRAVCAELPIHASTQMTLTSSECITQAEDLGIERVVLARELSVREIDKIHRAGVVPLEAFVHGALCVAYSGQCLTSESLGGRSANRGQCAQACRMTYELVCDGKDVDLGDQQYLLSPQDLAAYDLVPELIAAGVTSFKIEGRLKTAEYVANITSHYRRAIDSALAGQRAQFSADDVEEMQLSFSRGFSHGWLDGCDHKELVPGLSSAKHGVLLGEVVAVRGERIEVALRISVKPGDGIVLEGDRAAGQEQGGRIYELWQGGKKLDTPASSGTIGLALAHGAIDFSRVFVGQKVWKTDDPQLNSRLRRTFTGEKPVRRQPIDLAITATVGQPLQITATTGGKSLTITSPTPLEQARKHALTADVLREQFSRLGGTAYELRGLECEITGEPMSPLSVLGALRHELVDQLNVMLAEPPQRTLFQGSALESLRRTPHPDSTELVAVQPLSPEDRSEGSQSTKDAIESASPQLHVLCRSLKQLVEVVDHGMLNVQADFADIREYREAVAIARDAGASLHLATPRIQKPDELGIFRALARYGADGILVRNLAGVGFFGSRGVPMIGDFSLNTANELTAEWLMDRGLKRLTPSYDLNREQLLDLVAAVPTEWLEVVIHQHMPMFHMEHCVFCSVLSPGTNKTNCGRPCDHHDVRLRDRIGMEHPLRADVGCRNTLFNAVPQSGAEIVPELIARGVRHFRLELIGDEPDERIGEILQLYNDLLAGRTTGSEVWRKLRAANRVGVTRGTLEERRNPLAII